MPKEAQIPEKDDEAVVIRKKWLINALRNLDYSLNKALEYVENLKMPIELKDQIAFLMEEIEKTKEPRRLKKERVMKEYFDSSFKDVKLYIGYIDHGLRLKDVKKEMGELIIAQVDYAFSNDNLENLFRPGHSTAQ